MEAFGILLVLGLVVVVIVLPIAAFVRSSRAVRAAEQLNTRITALQFELARLKRSLEQQFAAPSHASERPASANAPRSESGSGEPPLAAPSLETGLEQPETVAPEPARRVPAPPI